MNILRQVARSGHWPRKTLYPSAFYAAQPSLFTAGVRKFETVINKTREQSFKKSAAPFSTCLPTQDTFKHEMAKQADFIKTIIKDNSIITKKRLPDTDSFKQAVLKNLIVVDHSMIIEMLDQNTLLAFPRRTGKTFNLSMIKSFFELEYDENGVELADGQKINRLLFENGATGEDGLSKKMLICEKTKFCEEHFGKYPVIHFSFIGTAGEDYKHTFNHIVKQISDLFLQFRFVRKSDRVSKNNLAEYETFLNKCKMHRENINLNPDKVNIAVNDVIESIKLLIEIVNTHFGKPVLLLIDEYDNPLKRAYADFIPKDLKKTSDLLNGIFVCAIKENNFLFKSVLTGVLTLSSEAIDSGLNCIKVCGLLPKPDYDIRQFYGFSEEQVDMLFKIMKINEIYKPLVKEKYSEFFFNNTPMYSTWSIKSALNKYEQTMSSRGVLPAKEKEYVFPDYFKPNRGLGIFAPLFADSSVSEVFLKLLHPTNNDASVELYSEVSEKNIVDLFKALKRINENVDLSMNSYETKIFYSFLIFHGCLIVADPEQEKIGEASENVSPSSKNVSQFSNTSDLYKRVKIPNDEIRNIISDYITENFTSMYGFNSDNLEKVINYINDYMIKKTNVIQFQERLLDSLTDFISSLPLFKNNENANRKKIHLNESFVDGIVCFTVLLSKQWLDLGTDVRSIKTKKLRTNIFFKNDTDAVFMEIKVNKTVNEAIKQIMDREYYRDYANTHNITLVGININESGDVSIKVIYPDINTLKVNPLEVKLIKEKPKRQGVLCPHAHCKTPTKLYLRLDVHHKWCKPE